MDPILDCSNDGLQPLSLAGSDVSESTPKKDGGLRSGDESKMFNTAFIFILTNSITQMKKHL